MKHFITLTNTNKLSRIDENTWPIIKKYKWLLVQGYVATKIDGKRIYLHRFLMNMPNGKEIDHINGNRLDNRICNLRICSHSENQRNKGKLIGQYTSNYKGICWRKFQKQWRATIRFKNRKHLIGYFKNEIDAAIAYDLWARELHGKFARLNFQPI